MSSGKPSKLKFKNSSTTNPKLANSSSSGASTAKPAKKRRIEAVQDPFAAKSAKIMAMADYGWLSCETDADFQGPLCIINSSIGEDGFRALAANESKGMIMTGVDCSDEHKIDECEPNSVQQIFHIYQLPSVSSSADSMKVWSIKSSVEPATYLSSTKYGQLLCDSLAVSLNEQWIFIRHPLESKFLIVNRQFHCVAQFKDGDVRCDFLFDFDTYHTIEHEYVNLFKDQFWWHVKCQSAELKKYKLDELEKRKLELKVEVDPRILELETSSLDPSHKNTTEYLKAAQKSGKLNEALLDTRAKSRSDRYCK